MGNIILFENYNKSGMELENEVQNHLSQYPYLSYDVKSTENGVQLTFNKDVSADFATGLLDPFAKERTSDEPVAFIINKKKNIDKFEEHNGKVIIENIEKVSFPELGITDLEVKIDTGATTSSLHCSKVQIDKESNQVSFVALDEKYDEYTGETVTMPLHSIIKVQSSNGDEEDRALVKMDIEMKGKQLEAYFSLADRKELEFPVLIGKDILSGKFLVNPGI